MAGNLKIDKAATVSDINTTNKTATISFDISWENSWRLSDGASNYDGVWIFARVQEKGTKEWQPVLFDTSVSDYGIGSNNGVEPAFSAGSTDNKCVGIFAFRKNNGKGNINWDGFKMKWNYELNGIADINNIL